MTRSESIFYSCVFISLLYESLYLIVPKYMRKRRLNFEMKYEDLKGNRQRVLPVLDHNEEEDPSAGTVDDLGIAVSFLSFIALCTCFAGMASSQALLFLVHFLFSLFVSRLYYRYKNFLWLYRLDGFVGVSLLVIILLNKFVYHITVYDIWKSL